MYLERKLNINFICDLASNFKVELKMPQPFQPRGQRAPRGQGAPQRGDRGRGFRKRPSSESHGSGPPVSFLHQISTIYVSA